MQRLKLQTFICSAPNSGSEESHTLLNDLSHFPFYLDWRLPETDAAAADVKICPQYLEGRKTKVK